MSPPVLIRPRFFDEDVKVYYINLAKRKDRNLHIQNELNKSVLLRHYERFEAVDANYVDLEPYQHLNLDLKDKKGEIGCALSHLSLWERCANDNRVYLIFEDDINLQEYFDDVLQTSLPYTPPFDLLYLVTSNEAERTPYNQHFDRLIQHNNLTGGYFISPHGARKLLEKLRPYNPRRPIDVHLADLTLSNDISSYIFQTMPLWIYQDYKESDIQKSSPTHNYYGEKEYNELDMVEFLSQFQETKLILIPNPGNGGDSLIAAGTFQLFDALNLDYQIGDIKKVYSGQVLFYAGGGNLVGLYKNGEDFLKQNLDNNRIVILPHTIKDCAELLEVVDRNPQTTIICREKISYNYVRNSLSHGLQPTRVFLSDDMAFYLNVDKYRLRRSSSTRTLNYFRRDREKTSVPLPSNNHDLSQDINIIPSMDNKKLIIKNAYHLLDEINKYSIINTNRLHGGIGGSLLNKQVNFYPNSYWKNQEVYNYSLRDNFPKTVFRDPDSVNNPQVIVIHPSFRQKKLNRLTRNINGTDVFIESSSKIDLTSSAEAFISAFYYPALASRRMICIEEPVDRKFLDNLNKIQPIVSDWWGWEPISIDHAGINATAEGGRATLRDKNTARGRPPKAVALFFTGGVDSFYALHQEIARIQVLINVEGFDVSLHDTARLKKTRKLVQNVGDALGLQVVFVKTNIKSHPDFKRLDWGKQTHVAALAMVAHSLQNNASIFCIAGTDSGGRPHGSHPLVDPLWGSGNLDIVTSDASRLEKVRAIANWPLVHSYLKVCWENKSSKENCGHCEKCLRTETAFAVLGQDHKLKVFPKKPSLEKRLIQHQNDIKNIKKILRDQWKNIYDESQEPLKSILKDILHATRN